MMTAPNFGYHINDNPEINQVLIHAEYCDFARERLGDGWSPRMDNLEAAVIAARRLNRRVAKGCFRCLREIDDLTRPIADLLASHPYR